jgi:hypothetical protein
LEGATVSNHTFDVHGATVFRCPPEACGENNTCLGNRIGPVCGLCPQQWALTATGCEACPSDEALSRLRMGIYFLIGIVFFLLWIFMSWRPLIPGIDAQLARFGQILGMIAQAFECFGGGSELKEARRDFRENWESFKSSMNNLSQGLGISDSGDLLKIFKIQTSYLQVQVVFSSSHVALEEFVH